MPAIEWNDDLSVGVDLIDSDHKTLIDLINLVANSIEARQTAKTIGDVIQLLYEYTEFHFIREEVLMEACGYSDLDNHRKVHQSLKKRVRAIRDQYAKNPDSVNAPEVLEFMTGWLTDHIMGQDMAYAPAMSGRFVHRTSLAS